MNSLKVGDRMRCDAYYHKLCPVGETGTITKINDCISILWDNGNKYEYLSVRCGLKSDNGVQIHFVKVNTKPIILIED